MIQRTLVASAITLALITGCSDSSPADGNEATDGGNQVGGNGDNPNPELSERSLQQFDNSDVFFEALRNGLVQQNSNFGDREDSAIEGDFETADASNAPVSPAVAESGGAGADGGTAAGSADLSVDTNTTSQSGGPVDVTGTNVQEIGVDEQDRMKSDGEFLYLLDNQYGYIDFGIAEPAVVDGGGIAVDEPDIALVDGADNGTDVPTVNVQVDVLPVDGGDGTGAADLSLPAPQEIKTRVRILSLQPDAPDATPVTDLEIDLGGGYADGMYLYKTDGKRNLVLTSTGFANYHAAWDSPYSFGGISSIVTKLNVTEPTQASVEQTFQIDGQIISSRRIGNNLFMASRYYPTIPGIDPYSMTPEEYETALQNTDLNDALPKMTQTSNGEVTPLVDPAGCFVAEKPETTDYYYTPDIVTLAVIDLDTFELKDSECFLGSTETLYATPNSVFLATTRWDYSDFPRIELEDTVTSTSFVDPRVDTDIHQFSINGSELTYSGSGVVSGHLGWNPLRKPFRMSEKDGYLRIATYSDQQNEQVSPINVTVLKLEGDGELTTVAKLPNDNNPQHIGKPGEQLYASRYLGDRGYLVTFRQTDPLYVIDFSNPEDPKLAGELEIDGYSDYLQPIGEDYLLGIGMDAVPAPDGIGDGFGAMQQGLKLSLFNVADASNPIEVQSLVVGERGTYSVALNNHRAITVQHATDTHPTRVAFGIDVAGLADPRPVTDPTIWYPWNFTGLHGFDIKQGDDAGIEKRGVMVVNSASNPVASPYGYYGDDRSVIVGDSVYYIHGSDVYAADWSDLGNFTGPR